MSSNTPSNNSLIHIEADIREELILHLPTLYWLLDTEQRAVGRTYLIAIAWIITAQEVPGRFVTGFDHFVESSANMNHIKDEIKKMLDSYGISYTFDSKNRLRIPRGNTKLTVRNVFRRYIKAFFKMAFSEGLQEDELVAMIRDEFVSRVMEA